MNNNTRAIAALYDIMLDNSEAMPLVRQIEAAAHLLDYECPPEVVDEAKAFLVSVAEDKGALVDYRLDALKLLRKVEARKIVPPKATVRDDPAWVERCRAMDIVKRRAALLKAGAVPFPPGCDDDLTGPDYVPIDDYKEESGEDLGEGLRRARLAGERKRLGGSD